ncbi:hypothetical protein CY34DRAFT_806589 [Suillus luteus UH-Slu-Lm8-n1]|uniref:Uncharacterized protein n=1 Tax=Suillus luteus UH-Slu-Lm8-n1 TaxID=930992 RepID=A0A0D0ASK9_9AGAM|nr:hypothetical protein CY34DRAFT_806589 [Suillus luteus UH-Slu-Lm8-n1]
MSASRKFRIPKAVGEMVHLWIQRGTSQIELQDSNNNLHYVEDGVDGESSPLPLAGVNGSFAQISAGGIVYREGRVVNRFWLCTTSMTGR